MSAEEEEPLLSKTASKEGSPQLTPNGQPKSGTPNLCHRGSPKCCTPESLRKKASSPTSWTEKISMSLENLKKNFRKAGSEEKTKIGDGSQLADSFEDLSVHDCNEDHSYDPNYQNISAIKSYLSKPGSKTKPTYHNQGRCAQIKELWTPPCSPDYRDHTTHNFDQMIGNREQITSISSGVQGMPLQKSATAPILAEEQHSFGLKNLQVTSVVQMPSTSQLASATHQVSSSHHMPSPKAAPRHSKESTALTSSGVYENVDSVCGMTPPSRCSGYSSGSRGSSETDLIHYQLEHIKSVDAIPDDLTGLSVTSLMDCLHLFELHNVALKFRHHQIDGQFFKIMTDQMFKDDAFNFSDYEILKLKRLRDGWRPKL